MIDCDVLIVGAGAAGLTAAIYTCRKQLKTIVLSIDIGGQTNLTNHIENYPGVNAQPGPVLMQKFLENAKSFGADVRTGKIIRIDKEASGTGFVATLDDHTKLTTKAVILAYGKNPRKLNIPGEETYFGKGFCTCVTCDAPLFKNKIVAVIGGGNAAVEGAIELSSIAKEVYLVHRRDTFRADEINTQRLQACKNVQQLLSNEPAEVKGKRFVESLVIKHVQTKTARELKVDGIFSEIGHEADSSAVQHLVKTNEHNEVNVDDRGNTSCPGIFAAGDITPVAYKQTVIAAGEGAKAALECHRWLTTRR